MNNQQFDSVQPVEEAATLTATTPEGWVWEAEMLRPGFSLNHDPASGLPRYYPAEFVREAAPQFEGCPCFADHQPNAAGSVRDLVGVFRNVRVAQAFWPAKEGPAGTPGPAAMRGELHLLRSEGWAREKLRAAQEAGLPVGLSISAFIGFVRATREGRAVMEARQLIAGLPLSVDLVTAPGAGGRVLRAVASAHTEALLAEAHKKFCRGGPACPPQGASRLAGTPLQDSSAARRDENPRSVHGANPGRATSGHFAGAQHLHASASGAKGAKTMETTPNPAPGNGAESIPAQVTEKVTELEHRVAEALAAQAAAEARLLLDRKVSNSKLPEPLANLVRERFVGADRLRVPGQPESGQPGAPGPAPTICAEQIDAEIKRVREAYAAVVPSPTRLSGARIEIGLDSAEQMQIALDKLLGVTHQWREVREGAMVRLVQGEAYGSAVPGFRGFQEAYVQMTGDRDIAWIRPAGWRVTEEWNSAGFATALATTLYRRMVQDYMELDYGLDLLVPPGDPHRVALRDFRTHEIIRVGYLGDLTQVDAEAVDWPEITAPTDEKSTITAVQFGGIITVTRKTILNDDVGLVARIAARIGRAARRSLARRIYKKWMVDNPNIYDGAAFFNTGGAPDHKNQRTIALSATELNTIRANMRDQTEKNSGEKIGVGPWILAVPHNLEGAARQENEREYLDASFTPNPVRAIFGSRSERILVSPLLTDTNDFYVFADPRELQTFQIGFLQGREQPELLLADNELVGKAFTSDRIQYKVRHEYETTVVDFRGAHKNVVA